MKVGDIYHNEPVTILNTASLSEAADKCVETGVSDLMVVDGDGIFQGVCSEGDLIRTCMPDYTEVMAGDFSPQEAFEIFLEKAGKLKGDNVGSIMVSNPISVYAGTHVQKAASYMVSKNIRRLPVLEDGKLIGTVSRAMIAKSILG